MVPRNSAKLEYAGIIWEGNAWLSYMAFVGPQLVPTYNQEYIYTWYIYK